MTVPPQNLVIWVPGTQLCRALPWTWDLAVFRGVQEPRCGELLFVGNKVYCSGRVHVPILFAAWRLNDRICMQTVNLKISSWPKKFPSAKWRSRQYSPFNFSIIIVGCLTSHRLFNVCDCIFFSEKIHVHKKGVFPPGYSRSSGWEQRL